MFRYKIIFNTEDLLRDPEDQDVVYDVSCSGKVKSIRTSQN